MKNFLNKGIIKRFILGCNNLIFFNISPCAESVLKMMIETNNNNHQMISAQISIHDR